MWKAADFQSISFWDSLKNTFSYAYLSFSDPSSSIGVIVTALAFNPDVTAFDLTARSVKVEVLTVDDLLTRYCLS